MFPRWIPKWGRGRSAKAAYRLREAVCQPLEGRLLLSKTIYVSVNSPAPATNGPSWGTAYKDLQQALAVAVSGDTIKVGQGMYKSTSGTDRTISFQLKTGVAIYGGYAGYGAANPDARNVTAYPTILSGDIGAVGNNTDNSYHVVVDSGTDSTAILDGFTITGGNANGSSSPTNYGGGMYNSSGSPTLANCTISGNIASSSGGGVYNAGSSPTLTNCTVSTNTAVSGGGVFDASSSSPALTNCTLHGNAATSGGGIYNVSSSPTLIDCTLSSNIASTNGSGMYDNASSNPQLTNCIVWWNSGSTLIYNSSSTPVITYSDIQGGYSGTGNINADPLFVRSPWAGPDGVFGTADDDYGDLRLRAGSPALDVGSNAAIPAGVTTDMAGNPRIQNGTVDLGAYEGAVSVPTPKTIYVDSIA
ncbi:MAG: right-handed parallel beta-helix repeat-containing protein, partial [Tepidisphaeraceae bacterium]